MKIFLFRIKKTGSDNSAANVHTSASHNRVLGTELPNYLHQHVHSWSTPTRCRSQHLDHPLLGSAPPHPLHRSTFCQTIQESLNTVAGLLLLQCCLCCNSLVSYSLLFSTGAIYRNSEGIAREASSLVWYNGSSFPL